MFCNDLIIVSKAGVNQAVSDTLQLIIKDIDDCRPVFTSPATVTIDENNGGNNLCII